MLRSTDRKLTDRPTDRHWQSVAETDKQAETQQQNVTKNPHHHHTISLLWGVTEIKCCTSIHINTAIQMRRLRWQHGPKIIKWINTDKRTVQHVGYIISKDLRENTYEHREKWPKFLAIFWAILSTQSSVQNSVRLYMNAVAEIVVEGCSCVLCLLTTGRADNYVTMSVEF